MSYFSGGTLNDTHNDCHYENAEKHLFLRKYSLSFLCNNNCVGTCTLINVNIKVSIDHIVHFLFDYFMVYSMQKNKYNSRKE